MAGCGGGTTSGDKPTRTVTVASPSAPPDTQPTQTTGLQPVTGPLTPTSLAACLRQADFKIEGIKALGVGKLKSVAAFAPDGSRFIAVIFPNAAQARQIGSQLAKAQGFEINLSRDGRTVILTDKNPTTAVLSAADKCTDTAG